jgi:hemerythrin-like domain-containing protein
LWAGLRTQISAIASAQPVALDASAVEAFIDANQRHVEREASEMLPMASRLFTDNELAYLRHALEGHRQPARL